MINVTKTFFPPIEDYQIQVQRIWDNQWLTNRGALVLELEENLKEYLQADIVLKKEDKFFFLRSIPDIEIITD
jgi:dTDP-4-amino-4,6-dideoxygalactose transaminase